MVTRCKINYNIVWATVPFLLWYKIILTPTNRACDWSEFSRRTHCVVCLDSPPTIPVLYNSQVCRGLMSSFFWLWSAVLHWKLAVLLQVIAKNKQKNPSCSLIYNNLLTVLLGGKGEHLCKWVEFLLREQSPVFFFLHSWLLMSLFWIAPFTKKGTSLLARGKAALTALNKALLNFWNHLQCPSWHLTKTQSTFQKIIPRCWHRFFYYEVLFFYCFCYYLRSVSLAIIKIKM